MKFGVIIFPGSNCDQDLIHVLNQVSNQETVKLWHKDTDLHGCTHIFVPGGFSYGDYLRSGAIAYAHNKSASICMSNNTFHNRR